MCNNICLYYNKISSSYNLNNIVYRKDNIKILKLPACADAVSFMQSHVKKKLKSHFCKFKTTSSFYSVKPSIKEHCLLKRLYAYS